MKNKRTLFITGGAAIAVIIAIILCAVLIPNRDTATDNTPDDTTAISQEINVEVPQEKDTDETTAEENSETDEGIPDDTTVIIPDDKETEERDDPAQTTGESAEKAEQPVAPAEPSPLPEETVETEETTIGGEEPEPYSCGVSGHHCEGPETHAYITNLELEGCPQCGSHSCDSFYAQDEWGNTCYTPSKCPKYDIKKDPAEYCQDCGKKLGDGTNDTCVQFVTADNCPNCNEYVDAWTCHTCK